MSAPMYDISEFCRTKVTKKRTPIELVFEFSSAVSDSKGLLAQEIAVRDFVSFDVAMGNGIDCLLGYGGGQELFVRGLNAMREIGLAGHAAVLEEAEKIILKHGIYLPKTVGETVDTTSELDWDKEQAIQKEMAPLNTRYWAFRQSDYDAYDEILGYLQKHRAALACRAPMRPGK